MFYETGALNNSFDTGTLYDYETGLSPCQSEEQLDCLDEVLSESVTLSGNLCQCIPPCL